MTSQLDESDVQDLVRRAAPQPVRTLDHLALQRRGRRHRTLRHLSAAAASAVVLVAVVLVTPFGSRTVAVDPAGGASDDQASSLGEDLACPAALADGWQCIPVPQRRPVPNAHLPQLGDTPPLPEDIRDLEPQVVVLNTWGTWCAPCAAQQPAFTQLASEVPDTVAVVGLAVSSSEAETIRYMQDHSISYLTLQDEDGSYLRRLRQIAGVSDDEEGESLLPATYIVDTSGRLAAWAIGPSNAQELRAAVGYAAAE